VSGILGSGLPKLGILLSHKYTLKAIRHKNLKGADQQLYEKLLMCQKLETSIYPIIYHFNYMKGDFSNARPNILGTVYLGTLDELAYLQGKGEKPAHNPNHTDIPFIAIKEGTSLSHWVEDGSEYTGNGVQDTQEDSVYFHGALVILKKD